MENLEILRNLLHEILVLNESAAMNPLNPDVPALVSDVFVPSGGFVSKVELAKYVIIQILSTKSNIIYIAPYQPNCDRYELLHELDGKRTTLFLRFEFVDVFDVLDCTLMSQASNITMKMTSHRIPSVEKFQECISSKTDFITLVVAGIANSFCRHILDKLDNGKSIPATPGSSKSTSGCATPGGRFLG